MDTFPVRLKCEGKPVAIVFRVDKDYYKGPVTGIIHGAGVIRDRFIREKSDRLLVWVNNDWEYVTSRDIL